MALNLNISFVLVQSGIFIIVFIKLAIYIYTYNTAFLSDENIHVIHPIPSSCLIVIMLTLSQFRNYVIEGQLFLTFWRYYISACRLELRCGSVICK